jgi:hypothetical protein
MGDNLKSAVEKEMARRAAQKQQDELAQQLAGYGKDPGTGGPAAWNQAATPDNPRTTDHQELVEWLENAEGELFRQMSDLREFKRWVNSVGGYDAGMILKMARSLTGRR